MRENFFSDVRFVRENKTYFILLLLCYAGNAGDIYCHVGDAGENFQMRETHQLNINL